MQGKFYFFIYSARLYAVAFVLLICAPISSAQVTDLLCVGNMVCGTRHALRNPFEIDRDKCVERLLPKFRLQVNFQAPCSQLTGQLCRKITVFGESAFAGEYAILEGHADEIKFFRIQKGGQFDSGGINRYSGALTIVNFTPASEINYFLRAECEKNSKLF
jgi:hypothetical protein